MKDCLEAVTEFFVYFEEGKVEVPFRTKIKAEKAQGTFLDMLDYCEIYEVSCVKVLNMFRQNIGKGISTINARILMMNPQTGIFTGLLDGNYVRRLWTGGNAWSSNSIFSQKRGKN